MDREPGEVILSSWQPKRNQATQRQRVVRYKFIIIEKNYMYKREYMALLTSWR